MEDEDCTVNDRGQIDVKYQGWTEINPTIYSYHAQVIDLDLSYNRLQSIPEEISTLRRLKYLNCENNEIETLPQSFGILRALRIVNFNRNKLTTLPGSIGNCFQMTELYLNENKIEILPQNIENCISLETLDLRNNSLIDLPLYLAKLIDTLKHLDVTNNPDLVMIPDKVKGDSEAIMWILKNRYDRTMDLRLIREATTDMGKIMQHNRMRIEKLKEEIDSLEKQKKVLENERESVWMYLIFRTFKKQVQNRLKLMSQQVKELFNVRASKVAIE